MTATAKLTSSRARNTDPTRRRRPAVPTSSERAALGAALDAADASVVLEIDGHDVALTHLDRVYWPAVPELGQGALTKRDFLRYLIAIAPAFLEHVVDRPLTLFRWPEGVTGRRVLMKHWEIRLPEFVDRVDVYSESESGTDQYILCDNLATLVWLGHMGTLEFHVWHSRVRPGSDTPGADVDFASSIEAVRTSVLERPDYILFDIDPFIYSGRETRRKQPEFNPPAFDSARRVALWMKALLDRMSLASRVKTSGKTGLHVVVPIERTLAYDAVREIARHVGDHVMREHRDEVTVDWSVERRTGKVFIDYNMNVRAKSMTAPYSPRGLPGAPVSMPLPWRDVERANPLDYRLTTAVAMLARRGDPWAGLLSDKTDLQALIGSAR